LRHHIRFYTSALLGVLVWISTARWAQAQALRLMLAGDVFFGVYLVTTAILATGATADELRERATIEDEGMILISLITVTAVVLSLASIFALLNQQERTGALYTALSMASVLLGWLTLHTVAAFHYAHLYYTKSETAEKSSDVGGLGFPNTDVPTTWDFLYYSFVVGMTAQVSDVQVLTERMRLMTLAHSVAAFFFNTVLLALAVNVAAGQAR
jgi:uncharacterized membrane protein